MATKISADIASAVDITVRRNDSFYLKTELTNNDGTAYNVVDATDATYKAHFEVYDSSDVLVLGFTSLTSGSTIPVYDGKITVSTTASLVIKAAANLMTIRSGSYKYKYYIKSDADGETNTIMVGKFKVVDI
jgi:hypothetical protein